MKLKLILAGVAAIAAGGLLYASDNVGDSSGTVRQWGPTRWSVTKTGYAASSATINTTTTITNVVQATPGIVGKIVFTPQAMGDIVRVYNSITAGGCSESTLLFQGVAASQTTTSSTGTTTVASPTLGAPVIYDLLPGLSATTGITVVHTRGGATATTGPASFINYDITR